VKNYFGEKILEIKGKKYNLIHKIKLFIKRVFNFIKNNWIFFIFANDFFTMKKLIIAFLFLLNTLIGYSQINELGFFLGGSNYIGDIGRTNYIYPNSLAFGGIYKWNFHPHISARATYIYSEISGDDNDSNNSFRKNRGFSFTNNMHEFAMGIEYNFFKYNLSKKGYTHAPYFFVEAAVNQYQRLDNTVTLTSVFPFGFGYKAKLANRIGIAFETSFRYTAKDDVDGYPFDNEATNIQINPNNNDWYVFTGFTLVYAFGRERCYIGEF